MQRPSSLIEVEGSASAFRGTYLSIGRECFIATNIDNQFKSLSDRVFVIFTGKALACSINFSQKRVLYSPSSQLFSKAPPENKLEFLSLENFFNLF